MRSTSRILFFSLCLSVMICAGHAAIGQVRYAIVSPGAQRDDHGALMNVGQTIVGNAVSSTHGMKAGGIPVLLSVVQPLADLDGDGDVDLDDQAIFAICMAGPEISNPPPGCTVEQFGLADIEGDHDVDMADFVDLAEVFFVP